MADVVIGIIVGAVVVFFIGFMLLCSVRLYNK